jgi:very-short-patch-repair endonuclease
MPNIKKSKDTGKFVKHATYVKKNCENCGIEFEIKQSDLKYGRGRCCSRKCVDENKKKTYVGQNNPSYGRKQSKEETQKRSDALKLAYKTDPSIKIRIRDGVEKFIREHGYYPGTDIVSIEKKKATNLRKYGNEWAGWSIPEIKQKADDTCVKRYGKTSLELANSALLNAPRTKPEQIVQEHLEKLKINFVPQYKLIVDGVYRYFDFMLTDFNILLEVDGDFWHANPVIYDKNNLHIAQIRTLDNDTIKNEMVRKANIKLIRFWASEVIDARFLEKLKEVVYEESTAKKN